MALPYLYQLTVNEAALLFQLMGIPEGETLPVIFGANASKEVIFTDQQNLIKQLEEAELLQSAEKEITLEPGLLNLLQACKYSSAVLLLQSSSLENRSSVSYTFISGGQIVRMIWSSAEDKVVLTSFQESLKELLSLIGEELQLPDVTAQDVRICLQPATLIQLQEQWGSKNMNAYESILRSDPAAQTDASTVASLMQSCHSIQQWGTFDAVIRGTDLRSRSVYFIGSTAANWIFIQNEERLMQGYSLTEPELIQTLYLIAAGTLKVLAPV
ncbi:hypothetical protein PV403_22405 [Paenibacillus sp. GYB006]|uniref:hypothetical protein n=1 Tax=Paenibacillus sp. GYB006 TaxID=2994394 RepID=UPI002F96C40E